MARRQQNLDAGEDEKLKINFMWPNIENWEEPEDEATFHQYKSTLHLQKNTSLL